MVWDGGLGEIGRYIPPGVWDILAQHSWQLGELLYCERMDCMQRLTRVDKRISSVKCIAKHNDGSDKIGPIMLPDMPEALTQPSWQSGRNFGVRSRHSTKRFS